MDNFATLNLEELLFQRLRLEIHIKNNPEHSKTARLELKAVDEMIAVKQSQGRSS